MQVKTFEAVSFKDAVKAVKQEFGNDAVILSTREKSAEGRPNVKVVEVTAAAANSSRSIAGASTSAASGNQAAAVSSAKLDAVSLPSFA